MYIFAAMLNTRLTVKYLLHRITANNRHGLHSPFVYRLVDKVIYDFCAKNAYPDLKNQQVKFRNDPAFTTLPLKVLQLLYRLAADFDARYIYTIGAISPTVHTALQRACPQAQAAEMSNYQEMKHPALTYINADAASAVQVVTQLATLVKADDVIMIQNIYRSRQGAAGWQAIKTIPQVTITIDLFWLQLVFFRTGQRREHFKVKY